MAAAAAAHQQQPRELPGYERDVNLLIDACALQAHDQQWLSFPLFKQLFQHGCYAYLHQAYWGCEHSPEYTQLLFAAALDRLDVPSPTAPAHSSLWQLHHLVPLMPAGGGEGQLQLEAAAAAAAAAGGVDDPDPGADGVDAMDVDAAADEIGSAAAGGFDGVQAAGEQQQLGQQQQQLQPQQQQQQLDLAQQACDTLLPVPLQLVSQQCGSKEEEGAVPPPPAAAAAGQQQDAPASSPWMAGAGQPQPQLPPAWLGDPLDLLASPMPSPAPAAAAAMAGPQAGMQQPPLEPLLLPEPAVPLSPVAAEQQHFQQQQQQHFQQQQGFMHDDESGFLADLLAILDEAPDAAPNNNSSAAPSPWLRGITQQQQQQQENQQSPGSRQQQQQRQPQRQQHMTLAVPLWVKGAVVFTLVALHESQLNLPKVPIYTPLPLLQRLAAAAAEFAAAGPPAADALQALEVLVSQQRLLVGQFRRPNQWEPQLPAWLMPGGRMPRNVGLNTAIGVAARKAARKAAAASGMQSAAVAAAARAARGAAGFDPAVHREALFHVKTALRTLSNFTSLQELCDSYASARRAIFEPLLPSSALAAPAGDAAPHSAARAQRREEQEEEERALAGMQPEEGPSTTNGPLVVQRGGSRQRRKAATANSTAAGGTDTRASQCAAAEAASAAASQRQQQQQRDEERLAATARQQEPADGAGVAGPPEVFDSRFAAVLQDLANEQASRMLLLLDPYYDAAKVRKRTVQQRQVALAAEAAAAAEQQEKLARFRQLTMRRAHSAGGAGPSVPPPRQQPQRSAPAAAVGRGVHQELLAAGIFSEEQLQLSGGVRLGPVVDAALGGDGGGGGMQQALRRDEQRRQDAVSVAAEWLRAQDALIDAEEEDMP